MLRAYSQLEVRSLSEDERLITGVATTPQVDRGGDIIEPLGISYKNPLPLLLYHDTKQPVGEVRFQKPTKDGVGFTAKIANVTEPGRLKDRVDEAWHSLKAKLLKFTSIGFRPLGFDDEHIEFIKGGGIRYKLTEVLELSLVTIPMNSDALIETVKSMDAVHLAASGIEHSPRPTAGATALPNVIAARKAAAPMNATERITEYQNARAAKEARMIAIQEKAGAEGRTKDDAEKEEFDAIKGELDKIDRELVDLKMLESAMKAQAVPVDGTTPKAAADSRGGMVVEVKSNLPKGTGFTRYAMALAAGRGSRMEAYEFAKRWEKSTPEVAMVLKAAVDAGTTTDATWAAPLVVYQNLASEFIELLRPATIIGRINGFRRVPFNVTMPRQTSGSTVGWVGQNAPKPVGELAFDQVSLGMAKAAGIIVIAEELARSSNPSAEAVISQDLRNAIAQFLDTQFVDPSVAAVTNVSPASVTNGASVIDSTGVTAAALRADFGSALAVWTAAELSIAGGVVLMTETQAIRLSMIVNAFGQPEFPGLTATGGTLFGLPVVTSENIPAEGGSPAGNRIILLKPGEILMADDGGITIDVSREASVQMNTTPDNPATASTVYTSFWQNNLVGIRAERFINWLKRRAEAAVIIEGALYTG